MSSNPAQINNRYPSMSSNLTSVAGPAQFAVLANVAVPTSGYYRIKCRYGYGGTAEATNQDNFELVVNAALYVVFPATVGNANTMFQELEFYMNLNAGDIVKIILPNAGSAGSIYKSFLNVDKMNG